MPNGQTKVLVIIPAYNEQGNVGKTIRDVQSQDLPCEILVVDDGSADQTAKEAADAGAMVISLPFNLGIGGAVQTGFKFAAEKNYSYAAQVDGDGQHDVHYLSALFKPLFDDRADVAIGSRFITPWAGYRSSLIRRLGISFFAKLISFLIRHKITDSTSGFRAYNQKAIRVYAGYYPHDYPEPEAVVIARRMGLRILEIPVQMRQRASGQSSIRYLMTLYYMIKVTFAILLDKLKQRSKG